MRRRRFERRFCLPGESTVRAFVFGRGFLVRVLCVALAATAAPPAHHPLHARLDLEDQPANCPLDAPAYCLDKFLDLSPQPAEPDQAREEADGDRDKQRAQLNCSLLQPISLGERVPEILVSSDIKHLACLVLFWRIMSSKRGVSIRQKQMYYVQSLPAWQLPGDHPCIHPLE